MGSFFHHTLIRKKNKWKFERKLRWLRKLYAKGKINREKVIESLEGWLAYVSHANTFKYRRKIVRLFNTIFPARVPIQKKVITKKTKNFEKKVHDSYQSFSFYKTLQLLKKGKTIQQVAEMRSIKVGTVWEHAIKGIASNHLSIFVVLPNKRVFNIIFHIHSATDTLKIIKSRIADQTITYDDIACVFAYYKKNVQS